MTLNGYKNHYNVKFLKGHGHSVSLKDNKSVHITQSGFFISGFYTKMIAENRHGGT